MLVYTTQTSWPRIIVTLLDSQNISWSPIGSTRSATRQLSNNVLASIPTCTSEHMLLSQLGHSQYIRTYKQNKTNKQKTFLHGSVETSEQAMDTNGKLQPVSGEQMVGSSALFYYSLRVAHTISRNGLATSAQSLKSKHSKILTRIPVGQSTSYSHHGV